MAIKLHYVNFGKPGLKTVGYTVQKYTGSKFTVKSERTTRGVCEMASSGIYVAPFDMDLNMDVP